MLTDETYKKLLLNSGEKKLKRNFQEAENHKRKLKYPDKMTLTYILELLLLL